MVQLISFWVFVINCLILLSLNLIGIIFLFLLSFSFLFLVGKLPTFCCGYFRQLHIKGVTPFIRVD
jgi:hypothetical protein